MYVYRGGLFHFSRGGGRPVPMAPPFSPPMYSIYCLFVVYCIATVRECVCVCVYIELVNPEPSVEATTATEGRGWMVSSTALTANKNLPPLPLYVDKLTILTGIFYCLFAVYMDAKKLFVYIVRVLTLTQTHTFMRRHANTRTAASRLFTSVVVRTL